MSTTAYPIILTRGELLALLRIAHVAGLDAASAIMNQRPIDLAAPRALAVMHDEPVRGILLDRLDEIERQSAAPVTYSDEELDTIPRADA